MALITRVSRLFRADVNAVLDRIEEPELLLKQAIREMAEALDEDRRRAAQMDLEIKQLSAREAEARHRLTEVDDELDLCFVSGNEALVRSLLKRKLETKQLLKFVVRKKDETHSASQIMAARISENTARLESMRQKAELFTEQDGDAGSADGWSEVSLAPQFGVTDEDIELELLREHQKRAPQ